MLEIRIHGRGGQGAVTFSELVAKAAYLSGWQAQAFPAFGVERRGAPIMAFARLDKQPIRLRSQVYQPDYLIVLDNSLMSGESVKGGWKKNTKVLVNQEQVNNSKDKKIISVPATALAKQYLGKPIVNTVMLGAFAGFSGLIKWPAVEQVIKEQFTASLAENNLLAAKAGFDYAVKK